MIYNNYGEAFYIHGEDLLIPSLFVGINSVWMMPLLFALAGISSRYALQRRKNGEYAKERVNKLLIPLIFGLLLLIPVQSYVAGMSHNGDANYLDFFTTFTDLSGYDGAFTPGQLWFIIYLFIISIVCLPLLSYYNKRAKENGERRIPMVLLIVLGIVPAIVNPIMDIGGKSLCEFAAYFLLAYFLLAREDVLERLDKYRFPLLGLFIAGVALAWYFDGTLLELVSWISVLTFIGMGRHYINRTGKIAKYLSGSSFAVYLFHQSWVVVAAFFIFKITDSPFIQIPLILVSAVALTYLSYEACRRTRITRRMFALKEP
jgi:surface polysaccharide O-acyltransferase-like enzyme